MNRFYLAIDFSDSLKKQDSRKYSKLFLRKGEKLAKITQEENGECLEVKQAGSRQKAAGRRQKAASSRKQVAGSIAVYYPPLTAQTQSFQLYLQ